MDNPSQATRVQERETLLLRLVWMLVFFCVWQLAELLLLGVVVIQIALRLLNGQTNADLRAFGDSLSQYIAQIGRFGSFVTEQKPWPLSDWPAPGTQTAARSENQQQGPQP